MIGTFGHEIVQTTFNAQNKSITNPQVRIHGHYAPKLQDLNEAWGLSVFPNQDKYVTVSDDGTMRVWDTNQHTQHKLIKLTEDQKGAEIAKDTKTKDIALTTQGRSVDVSPDGAFIAVGMRDGSLRVYSTKNWKMTYRKKISKEWIEDLKFSPNG